MSRRISSPELIGRRRVMADLAALLKAASRGEPSFVLIEGEAGIGKSRVLTELTERAEQAGMGVLSGACVDLGEGAPPFGPVADALRRLARNTPDSRLEELLGPSRRELARLAPGLAPDHPPQAVTAESRPALFNSLLDALARLGRGKGLLITLEDLHWADASTLELVAYLARGLRDEQVLIAATVRSDELHRRHRLRPVLGELSRLPVVTRIPLEPLEPFEIETLAVTVLGRDLDQGLAREVTERSGGNPFYAEELLAAANSGGPIPVELQEALTARLAVLPEPTREVLEVVATLRRDATDRLLAMVADLDPGELARRLRPAVEHQILLAEESTYRFRHALMQEAVYDELLPPERVGIHRRIAEVLEQHPELAAGGPEAADAELAHHWHAVHDVDRAFAASLRAGERAMQAAAFAEALSHYERALGLWDQVREETSDRGEVLVAAADAATRWGADRRAVAHLEAALAALPPDPTPEAEAEVRVRLASARFGSGDETGSFPEVERAFELMRHRPPSRTKLRALVAYGGMLRLNVEADPAAAVPPAREAVETARELQDPLAEAEARRALGSALLWSGHREEAADHLRHALSIAREHGDRRAVAISYGHLLNCHFAFLRDETATQLADEVWDWLEVPNQEPHDVDVELYGWVGYVSLRRGDWRRAEDAIDRISRRHLEGHALGVLQHARGQLRWSRAGWRRPATTSSGSGNSESSAAGTTTSCPWRRRWRPSWGNWRRYGRWRRSIWRCRLTPPSKA